MASFLNEKWNVVPNRVRPYNIFNRIFHIEQRRKVVDANQEAFMNLTSVTILSWYYYNYYMYQNGDEDFKKLHISLFQCLLSTANALISTTIDGNAECPLSVSIEWYHISHLGYIFNVIFNRFPPFQFTVYSLSIESII